MDTQEARALVLLFGSDKRDDFALDLTARQRLRAVLGFLIE